MSTIINTTQHPTLTLVLKTFQPARWSEVAQHPNVTPRLSPQTDLADLLLGGFEWLDDAVQLGPTGQQSLLQLGLLLLESTQVHFGAAQFIFLATEVSLLGADLALQGWNLAKQKEMRLMYMISVLTAVNLEIIYLNYILQWLQYVSNKFATSDSLLTYLFASILHEQSKKHALKQLHWLSKQRPNCTCDECV